MQEEWEIERRHLSLETMQQFTEPEQILVPGPIPLQLTPIRRLLLRARFPHGKRHLLHH
jgi:hypothetical protein